MGLFSSKMSDAEKADLQKRSASANDLRTLAIAANGHGVTSVDKRKARAVLEQQVGSRKANKLQEDALRQAGARPKGLGRLLG